MAESTYVRTLRDGTITLTDGTSGTAKSYTVAYENGDFSATIAKADRVVIRDRHAVAGLRKGADPIPTFSFSVHMREFTNGSADTLVDIIDDTGFGAAWVSTGGTGFEQVLFDVTITVDDPGGGTDSTLKMTKCHLTWDFSEGDPDTISVSGECYGAVTKTGPA